MKNIKFLAIGLLLNLGVSSLAVAGINKIYLTLSSYDFSQLNRTKGSVEFPLIQAKVNDGLTLDASLKIRGNSCLAARRKCLGIKFKDKVAIGNLNEKKYNLVSMWQDEGYVSSKIGYTFLNQTNITSLKTTYTEVYINNANYGLYLLTEVPRTVLEKKEKSPFIIRRGYDAEFLFDKEYAKNGATPTEEELAFNTTLTSFYSQFENYSGTNLINFLSNNMNLNKYLKWMALNYILMNGDYTDEVFFYVNTDKYLNDKKTYFEIQPWDYDDIFKTQHDIKASKKYYKRYPDALIYCFEDPLDKLVGTDSTLNRYYKQILKDLIVTQITPEFINGIIDGVKAEILPYLENSRTLSLSKLDDGSPEYTKDSILWTLEEKRTILLNRRAETLNRLSYGSRL